MCAQELLCATPIAPATIRALEITDKVVPMEPAEDRIILSSERRQLIPYSDMHIWRMEKDGRFPCRIKLGPNRVGWSPQEVREWIDIRKAERNLASVD